MDHQEDHKRITEAALLVLQNTLRDKGAGDDANLVLAIRILRECPFTVTKGNLDKYRTELDPEVKKVWNQILDPEITTHCQPTGWRNGTLFVDVDSNVWLSEIVRYRRKDILKCLQQSFGPLRLERISYRAGHGDSGGFQFFLPVSLHTISSSPQSPARFPEGEAWSAQRCVRAALDQAHPGLQVSFTADIESEVDGLSRYWSSLVPGYSLNDNGISGLRDLLASFEPSEISVAMRKAANHYVWFEDGHATSTSVNAAWAKVGGICQVTRIETAEPHILRLYYIRAIVGRRFPDAELHEALALMRQAAQLRVDMDKLQEHTETAGNYESWRTVVENFIRQQAGHPGPQPPATTVKATPQPS